MFIVIPTYMREDRQKCWNALPDDIKPMVTLATHSGRAEELRHLNPGAKVMDLGTTDGIADVRQKLLLAAPDDKVLIMDDSCVFKRRNQEMKLVAMTSEDFRDMFRMVEEQLENYSMVGISDQAGNNRVTEDIKEIGRSYSCYGVNREVWQKHGISLDVS